MNKIGGALACLLFAVCFGGVGAFASWVIGGTLLDWQRSKDWVRVKANVDSYSRGDVTYHYEIDGRRFTGDRLNPSVIGAGGSDNVPDEVYSRVSTALSEKTPITVFVDPNDPSRSMVDREPPWKMTLFFIPFALAFGGVGVGALWMLGRIVTGADDRPKASSRRSDGVSNTLGVWVFAFFWNAISVPIALIAVPEMWADGEYWGLFILIFPLIGLFMIWAALSTTWTLIRGGSARLTLNADPRAGAPLQGFMSFPRGVKSGESMRVRLACNRITARGKRPSATNVEWFREQVLRTIDSPQGVRLSFRFEIPANALASAEGKGTIRWRLEASPSDRKGAAPYGFDLEMRAAEPGSLASDPFEAASPEPDEPQLAAAGPERRCAR
jgi:hypothetical protein